MSKSMKSTWDAVNELRGVLSLSKQAEHHTHLASCRSGVGVYSVYASDVRSDLVVCTIAEFNELVEEMTLGLDVSGVTHGELFDYVNAGKVLLEKEVKVSNFNDGDFVFTRGLDSNIIKKLEESANNNGFISKFVCMNPLIMYIKANEVRMADSKLNLTNELSVNGWISKSKVNKPLVYTQEMADNGELPSVGMMVELIEPIHGNSAPLYVVHSYSHMVWVEIKGGAISRLVKLCQIKPVDTRTKKEKAIDEIESELSKIAYSTRSALELAYDEWVGE